MKDQNETFVLRENKLVANNEKLSKKSKARMKKWKADNTLKAYASDWDDFAGWCAFHENVSLPAEPETVVNYINDLADYAKANTTARRLSAISENHIAAGFAEKNPVRSALVRNAIAAIRREKGTLQKGKTPLLLEDMDILVQYFDVSDIVGIRDRALLLLGFSGAFRRSELVAINVEHLTFAREGLIVLIENSKADQVGEGAYLAIPYRPESGGCAVRAVRAWLDISQIKNGPLFRPFTKNKKLRDLRLSDKSVALIVKKYAALAGFAKEDFAGHSLRRGFATSAAQHDVDEMTIMQQTRHHSEKMVRRYIEQGNLFKRNALSRMFK